MSREDVIFSRDDKRYVVLRLKMRTNIREFLKRDENSAPAPGTKDSVKNGG